MCKHAVRSRMSLLQNSVGAEATRLPLRGLLRPPARSPTILQLAPEAGAIIASRAMLAAWLLCMAAGNLAAAAAEATNTTAGALAGPRASLPISLRECVERALAQNHDLQIERLNPVIARYTLQASYGYYDPALIVDSRRDGMSDSGGFDPADLSKDAIYEAESCTVKAGLTGVLPFGLTYSLGADYANSFGTRNNNFFDFYNLFTGISVRQPLLKNFWIDQSRLLIKVNRKNLRITELAVAYLAMDIINQVQQAYCGLIYAREYVKLQESLVRLRERLLAVVQSHMRHGKMTAQEEHLALAQIAEAKAELLSAQKETRLAESVLRTLLGDSFTNVTEAAWEPTGSLAATPQSFGFAECARRGLAQRPDVQQLRADLEKTELDVQYRRNQLLPALDLVAGYGRRGASTRQASVFGGWAPRASLSEAQDQISSGDNPNHMVGVVFSLPLSRTAERARYRASKELKAQAALRLEQREALVLREIADALHTVNAEFARIQATRQGAAAARLAVQGEELRMAGGTSSVYLVLQLQDDLADAEVEALSALADYNRALSQLAFAQGDLLRQWGIELEFK